MKEKIPKMKLLLSCYNREPFKSKMAKQVGLIIFLIVKQTHSSGTPKLL